MSLATFKKKTINSVSTATNISGKNVNKFWIYQGPYGSKDTLASTIYVNGIKDINDQYGLSNDVINSGFSINGSHLQNVYVGKSMKFSKSGTPFRGQYPMGSGGCNGHYSTSNIVYNMPQVRPEVEGTNMYVKPSVLSTKGMLERRYRWINSGQYPTNWVQPVYTGNQTDSSSQGQYIHTKSAANDCVYDVNDKAKYETYFVKCCDHKNITETGYKMVVQQGNAPYTKTLYRPQDSSAYTLRIQRKCQNPTGPQKPFPYRVQNGTGVLRGGTSVSRVASACNTQPTFVTPPDWYLNQ